MITALIIIYSIIGIVVNMYTGYKRFGLFALNPIAWVLAVVFIWAWPLPLIDYLLNKKDYEL